MTAVSRPPGATTGRSSDSTKHLERLGRSAEKLQIPLPSIADVRNWALEVAEARGNGVLRIFASHDGEQTNIFVFSLPEPEVADAYRLLPVTVPWHPAGADWALAGVKTLSYAPNMAATRMATDDGFDDALLVSSEGIILEAPTSAVLWVVDDVIETATLDLGILASVTRDYVLDYARQAGYGVVEGTFELPRLESASEVAIMSTSKGNPAGRSDRGAGLRGRTGYLGADGYIRSRGRSAPGTGLTSWNFSRSDRR